MTGGRLGIRAICLTLALLPAWVSFAVAQNWPEFRGPHGDGHADVKTAPTKWSETENLAWKTPLEGKAWCSPVVWGKQIWFTNAPADGKWMNAVCADLETGKIVHDVRLWDVAEPQFCHDMNSFASSTPVIEEGRVYVHFGVHGTACLDTKTGEVLWKRPPFDPELPCNHHRGAASSPILHGKSLILTYDGFDVQYVVALEKATGKIVWKRDREIDYGSDNGDVKKAYSTPHVFQVDGHEELVSPTAGATIAYDPKTGDELWRIKTGGMNTSIRPFMAHGMVYGTTFSGGIQLFTYKLGGRGDVTDKNIVWQQSKGASKRSSPILVEEKIYMAGDDGILTCVDAISGKPIWNQRVGGTWAASPVYAAGLLYFFDIEEKGKPGGRCFVITPGDKYQEVALNKLDAGCMASPAVVEGSLIVRTKQALYRIGK